MEKWRGLLKTKANGNKLWLPTFKLKTVHDDDEPNKNEGHKQATGLTITNNST